MISHSTHLHRTSIFLLLVHVAPALADIGWKRADPETRPSPRTFHAMTYDTTHQVTLLHGGYTGQISGQTWQWNGTTWQAIGTGPEVYTHAIAFDPLNDTAVLFGNYNGTSSTTWGWNGSSWNQLETGAPLGRESCAMAYDTSRQVIVLFGGFHAAGGIWYDDTWEWDGQSWNQCLAGGGPSKRRGHAMTFDKVREVVVLFGGTSPNGILGDTWEYNGTEWTLCATTGPAPRAFSQMAYDCESNTSVLFGGSNSIQHQVFGDTWLWDGASWTNTQLSGPTPRKAHGMAYDPVRGEIVMFGGGRETSEGQDDTWILRLTERPRGRVTFADGTPIRGAEVRAYTINGNVIEPFGEVRPTDEDGYYIRPSAFDNLSFHGGIMATVTYVDPATGAHSIVNYPNNNPFPAPADISGVETIVFPLPVVLQGGLFGGIVTWNVFGQYLRSDPAVTPSGFESFEKFADNTFRIPAFLTFTMPSNYRFGDNVSWGYDNAMPLSSPDVHDWNAARLNDFVQDRIWPSLHVVEDPGSLPIYLCAHSMGGLISRSWMWRTHRSTPPVQRYVSFDGVHGGTTWFGLNSSGTVRGFAEFALNGISRVESAPPSDLGWNYGRTVDADLSTERNLLISSSCVGCMTVDPNCSAFGVGRTMMWRRTQDNQAYLAPNGHRARFIGGIEWHRNEGHSDVKAEPEPVFHAARFLAFGVHPPGSTPSEDAADCQDAPPPKPLDVFPGHLAVEAELDSGEAISVPVELDENVFIEVSIALEGRNAATDFRGPGGSSLIPPDALIVDIAEGLKVISFSVPSPPVGTSTFQLTAGDTPASLRANIEFSNERKLTMGLPAEPVTAGTPILLLVSISDSVDEIIVGSGSAETRITFPDQSRRSFTLFDDGSHGDAVAEDGIYSNIFDETDQGGRYALAPHVEVQLPGEQVERTAVGAFIVDSAPGMLLGIMEEVARDSDFDGKFDVLSIGVDVAIEEAGDYQIRASLRDLSDTTIEDAHEAFSVQSVPTVIRAELQFSGAAIVRNGVEGPWLIKDLQLVDDDQALFLGGLPDYITMAYPLADFEAPPSPSLVAVSPAHGPREGGNHVLLHGMNLGDVNRVTFDERAVMSMEVVSDTAIRVVVPSTRTKRVTAVDIELTTPWHAVRFDGAYTYLPQVSEAGLPETIGAESADAITPP